MTELSDLISRKRIRYELGESTMPKKYRDFCLRVIDSERLTPIVKLDQYIDFETILYCMEHTLDDSIDDEERKKIRQAYHPLLDMWRKEQLDEATTRKGKQGEKMNLSEIPTSWKG